MEKEKERMKRCISNKSRRRHSANLGLFSLVRLSCLVCVRPAVISEVHTLQVGLMQSNYHRFIYFFKIFKFFLNFCPGFPSCLSTWKALDICCEILERLYYFKTSYI